MEAKDIAILIRFHQKQNVIEIGGTNDSWMDLVLCIEGLGVIAQKCINDGHSQEKVFNRVQEYLLKVLSDEPIIKVAGQSLHKSKS